MKIENQQQQVEVKEEASAPAPAAGLQVEEKRRRAWEQVRIETQILSTLYGNHHHFSMCKLIYFEFSLLNLDSFRIFLVQSKLNHNAMITAGPSKIKSKFLMVHLRSSN